MRWQHKPNPFVLKHDWKRQVERSLKNNLRSNKPLLMDIGKYRNLAVTVIKVHRLYENVQSPIDPNGKRISNIHMQRWLMPIRGIWSEC